MTTDAFFPPSHWDVDEPQPEFCDLCGTYVGGQHLQITDVDGLRGMAVCDVTPGCRKFRSRHSWRDRFRQRAHHSSIGSSRVFPAGTEKGGQDPP